MVKVAKNSLNNRFVPYDVIETDAVFAVDDDVEMRHDEILLAFRYFTCLIRCKCVFYPHLAFCVAKCMYRYALSKTGFETIV